MNSRNVSLILKNEDEFLHEPTRNPKWRESYYFNWVDLKNQISGFSTIGLLPNEKRRELVFILFLKEKNEVYYKEPLFLHYEDNIETMLLDKRLSYKLIEPFKTWEIKYTSRKLDFKLSFNARFPTYSFGVDSSASWHQHFEASGFVIGFLRYLDKEYLEISGYGQRDKSWGYRDWHQFDKWYAGHFQFKDWSCTFRKDYYGDRIDLSGHTSKIKENIALSQVEIETINDNDKFKSPLSTNYLLKDINNNEYAVKAQRIKKDSFMRFVRNYQGGYTELYEQMVKIEDIETGEIGSGMMEHLRNFRKTSHKN